MDNVYDINGNVLKFTPEPALQLKGHSWSVLGDSISHPGLNNVSRKYWVWLTERAGGMNMYNYGISGTRITNFTQRYTQMHYSDIITVFGGVNDWGQQNPTPMGTISDATNSTFYGALNILCSGLLTRFPKSTIIFLTPLGNKGFSPSFYEDENSLGLTVYDYADAILAVCKKYKIPVIDTCRNSLLNPYISEVKAEVFVDGLHLNEHGHEILSYLIEDELLKHYIPTISDEALPSDYEQLPYITADGNQSLRTNYIPVQNDEFHIRYKGQNGTLISAGNNTYQLLLVGGFSYTGWYYKYFSNAAGSAAFELSTNSWYDIEIDKNGVMRIDGKSVTVPYEAALDGTATDLWIAERRNGSTGYSGSIAEFWIKNNDEYKMRLIPCRRNSDQKVGMYDTVSETFFASSKNDFIAGTN